MINLIQTVLVVLALIPVGLYIYAKCTVVEGYEDADGFHYLDDKKQVKK